MGITSIRDSCFTGLTYINILMLIYLENDWFEDDVERAVTLK
jgi:hypothetical protein